MTYQAFSTARFAPAERTRAWTENIRGSLYEASIHPFSESGIEGESYVRSIDRLTVTAFRTNEHTVQRTPELIRSNPKRTLFLSTMLSGTATLYEPGATHIARSGDTLVYSPDVPYLIAFQPGSSQLFTEMPSEEFSRRFGCDRLDSAKKVASPGLHVPEAAVGNLKKLAAGIASRSTTDLGVFGHIERLLAEVGRVAFPPIGDAVVGRARAYIDANASDPDLTPALVAEQMHLSLRQLNRLFSMEGSTVAGHLANARLLEARRLLEEAELPLTDIAAMSGFGSVSTLYRHLRRPEPEARTEGLTLPAHPATR